MAWWKNSRPRQARLRRAVCDKPTATGRSGRFWLGFLAQVSTVADSSTADHMAISSLNSWNPARTWLSTEAHTSRRGRLASQWRSRITYTGPGALWSRDLSPGTSLQGVCCGPGGVPVSMSPDWPGEGRKHQQIDTLGRGRALHQDVGRWVYG